MRIMYDSVTPEEIPIQAEMVAGYIDGNMSHVWSPSEWNFFPNAVKVRIARVPETDDGHVLDVEQGILGGEWPPGPRMVQWVQRRRNSGMIPTVYCNQLNDWPKVRFQFTSRQVPEPLYWVARYNNVPVIPDGAIAKQYAHPPQLGFNADASVVADYWPGVDNLIPPVVPFPESESEEDMRTYFVHGDNGDFMPEPHQNTTWGDAVFLVEADADGLRRRHMSQQEWYAAAANGAKLSEHPQSWVDSIPWGAKEGLFYWETEV